MTLFSWHGLRLHQLGAWRDDAFFAGRISSSPLVFINFPTFDWTFASNLVHFLAEVKTKGAESVHRTVLDQSHHGDTGVPNIIIIRFWDQICTD